MSAPPSTSGTMPSAPPHGLLHTEADAHAQPAAAPCGMPMSGMNDGVQGQHPGLATGEMPRGDFGTEAGQSAATQTPGTAPFGDMPGGAMGQTAMPAGAMTGALTTGALMTGSAMTGSAMKGAAMQGARPSAATVMPPGPAHQGVAAAPPATMPAAAAANTEGITLGGSWRLTFDLRATGGNIAR